jgi:hypothetical protein
MDNTELILLIQRILREFPRHRDIIALCEACETLALAKPVKPRLSRAEIQRNYRQRKKARLASAKPLGEDG